MKIRTKTEPVYYIVHDGVEIDARVLLDAFDDMAQADRTTFSKKVSVDMAILDLIKKETDEFMEANPDHRDIYDIYEDAYIVRIEWYSGHSDMLDKLITKIGELLDKAERSQ